MPTNYPTSIDTLPNPSPTDTLDSGVVPHDQQHANANDSIEAIQTKLGINNSNDSNSIDYKVSNSSSINPGHLHSSLVNPLGTLVATATGNSLIVSGTIEATNLLGTSEVYGISKTSNLRGSFKNGVPFSNWGTALSSPVKDSTNTNFLTEYSVPCFIDGEGVKPVFVNWASDGLPATDYSGESWSLTRTTEAPAGVTQFIEFAVYNDSTSGWISGTFSGSATGIILSGGNLIGDWMPIKVRKDQRLKIRTRLVSASAGKVYGLPSAILNPQYLTSWSSTTTAPAITATFTTTGTTAVGPVTLMTQPYDTTVTPVAIIGDSTIHGGTDTGCEANPLGYDAGGMVRRGLNTLGVPCISLAQSGDFAYLNDPSRIIRRLQLLVDLGCSHLFIGYGANDVTVYNSAENIATYMGNLAQWAKGVGFTHTFVGTVATKTGGGTTLYTGSGLQTANYPSYSELIKLNKILRSDTKRNSYITDCIDFGQYLNTTNDLYWAPPVSSVLSTIASGSTTSVLYLTTATVTGVVNATSSGALTDWGVLWAGEASAKVHRITNSWVDGGRIRCAISSTAGENGLFASGPTTGESVTLYPIMTYDGTHSTTQGAIVASRALVDKGHYFSGQTTNLPTPYSANTTFESSLTKLVHYKANDLATLWQENTKTTPVSAAGQLVGAWTSQVGGATFDLVQAASGARPTYSATGFAGAPAVVFDGSNDNLRHTTLITAASSMTIVILMNFISGSGTRYFFDSSGSSNRHNILRSNGRFSYDSNDSQINLRSTEVPRCIVVVTNGASSFLVSNGSVSSTFGTQLTGGQTGLTLGADRGPSVYTNYAVHEVTVYSEAMTVDQAIAFSKSKCQQYNLIDLNLSGVNHLI